MGKRIRATGATASRHLDGAIAIGQLLANAKKARLMLLRDPMKHHEICAVSIALFASFAFVSGCSGGGAVAADADAAVDPASVQGVGDGTDTGGSTDPTGDSLGNGGSNDAPPSAGTDVDAGASPRADGGGALDGAADGATGAKLDGGQASRPFGEPCNRDAQCASGACTRSGGGGGGGGGGGYCSIRCTTADQAAVCTKPPTNGQCVRGFCGKP